MIRCMIGCDWFSKYVLGKSNADGLIDVYTLSGLHRGLNARYNQIICITLSMKHDRGRERERERERESGSIWHAIKGGNEGRGD